MLAFSKRVRLFLARLFARLFHTVCDPSIERQIAAIDDYSQMQNIRRRQVERFLEEYLGPRI